MPKHYAHTNGSDPANWEPLDEHLCLVAEYAERFAAKFDAAAWGKMLGLWHDLRKYSKEFQAYLAKSGNPDIHQSEVLGRVDHSTAGAVHATKQLGEIARYRLKASKSSKLFKRLQK
jgi:CRISPR-associated endonuclease/helicase Cas3